jgi:biopolymer transport protein ExbB/TolQ
MYENREHFICGFIRQLYYMKKGNRGYVRWRALSKAFMAACIIAAVLWSQDGVAQSNSKGSKYALFEDKIPAGAQWATEGNVERDGGARNSKKYIYLNPDLSPANLTGMSLRIRENPGAGEYRYVTFKWIAWGGDRLGLRFLTSSKGKGSKFNYTYAAGKMDSLLSGLQIDEMAPGNWITVTRDLWRDFGDFTLTGLSFICPDRRDAGFDDKVFTDSPGVLPTRVAQPVAVKEAELTLDDLETPTKATASGAASGGTSDTALAIAPEEGLMDEGGFENPEDALKVDWAQQIRAGGVWMYPLYLLGFYALVITIIRIILSRRARLAPKKMRNEVRLALANNNIDEAIAACEEHPSTLSDSLQYIFEHRNTDRDVVSQVSGDMAGREIREQLDKIYPLSVVASLGPLLGLLGTIVGMIEAFGLVAIYGDEGGPSLLSNSISLALVTTAAGLIVAIPAIAIYFYLKRSIKGTATIMEEELEHALTVVYIQASPQNDKQKLLTVGESDISQNDFVDEESDQNDENTPFDKE